MTEFLKETEDIRLKADDFIDKAYTRLREGLEFDESKGLAGRLDINGKEFIVEVKVYRNTLEE